jgi:Fe2+ transport system protein FeoA
VIARKIDKNSSLSKRLTDVGFFEGGRATVVGEIGKRKTTIALQNR